MRVGVAEPAALVVTAATAVPPAPPTRVGVRLGVGLGPVVLVMVKVAVGPMMAITGVSLGATSASTVSVGRGVSMGTGVSVAGLAVPAALRNCCVLVALTPATSVSCAFFCPGATMN